MANGPITDISDVVVPEIFTGYTQLITEEKARIIQSGAAVRDAMLDQNLAGGGLTFNSPSFKDLDNDDENVSTDDADDQYTGGSNNSTPKKTGTVTEIAVALNRNNSWSSADLASDLAGADPMNSIATRVGGYWTRRLQAMFIATMKGVFADNDAPPTGTEHVQGDLSNIISEDAGVPGDYEPGVTDFSDAAFLDALVTMGDSQEALGMVMVHSIVYNRMQKLKLIDYIYNTGVQQGVDIRIPTFLGREVIVDDSMPAVGGVYDTWIFGAGATKLGMSSPKVPTAFERHEGSGNGGGSEVLYNRVMWSLHPIGHKYNGTPANGGPSNAATLNNLAHADSWMRVFTERKQIPIARLVTREHA